MDGIMYSAGGDYYVAQALASARSSLRHNQVPHLLFAAPPPRGAGDEGLSIEPYEPSENPYLDKIANMRRSPFDRTIFLDSDTYVTREIVHVFDVLEHHDMAATLAPGYRGLDDPEVPIAFCEYNTGVLAWKAGTRTAAFMECWQETYAAWQREPPFDRAGLARGVADQPAFRRCAWEHRMQVVVLPLEYNYRTGMPGSVVGPVRVVHGRHDDFARVAARLNGEVGPRTFPPLGRTGEPLEPGEYHLSAFRNDQGSKG